MIPALLAIIVSIAFAAACAQLAKGKRREPVLWGALGFFFGIIALIIILVLPPRGGA